MKGKLSAKDLDQLLKTLEKRFTANSNRHKGISWSQVLKKIEKNDKVLRVLHQMESTGGEPDVVLLEADTASIYFVDCSPESPKERRSICYDTEALDARKEHKPVDSAINMAEDIGIEILDEEQYKKLQSFGEFDTKTSSWIKTTPAIRKLGGALFADRRYNHVFVYHNGASSYYAARGFRGFIKI